MRRAANVFCSLYNFINSFTLKKFLCSEHDFRFQMSAELCFDFESPSRLNGKDVILLQLKNANELDYVIVSDCLPWCFMMLELVQL